MGNPKEPAPAGVEAYDPRTDSCERKADAPTAGGVRTCVVNGLVYAVGGHGWWTRGSQPVAVYDLVADAWETKGDIPTASGMWGFSAVDGVIYIAGGGVYIEPLT